MEMILHYGDALTNTGNAVIAKDVVKEIARKKGLYATFMPFPFNGISGSGYHLHQSLRTVKTPLTKTVSCFYGTRPGF
jgi:glutamine synthetase